MRVRYQAYIDADVSQQQRIWTAFCRIRLGWEHGLATEADLDQFFDEFP